MDLLNHHTVGVGGAVFAKSKEQPKLQSHLTGQLQSIMGILCCQIAVG